MSWWGYERKYEKEYRLANRVGRIVAHKMLRDKTNIVKLKVSHDNPLTNWFHSFWGGYRTTYGGWCESSSDKCFQKELFYGWLCNFPDRDKYWNTCETNLLRVIRTKYSILFLNLTDAPQDVCNIITKLELELYALERLELEKSYEPI